MAQYEEQVEKNLTMDEIGILSWSFKKELRFKRFKRVSLNTAEYF